MVCCLFLACQYFNLFQSVSKTEAKYIIDLNLLEVVLPSAQSEAKQHRQCGI